MSEGTKITAQLDLPVQIKKQPEAKAESDQLVVDLEHWPPIKSVLDDLGVVYTLPVEDGDLGLALVPNLVDAAGVLVDLDELLAELRNRFASERQGLAPLVGTNRFVDAIVGLSHKIMDVGVPEDASGDVITEFDKPTSASAKDFPGGALPSSDAGRGVRVGIVDTPMSLSAQQVLRVQTRVSPVDSLVPPPFRAGHSEFVASLIRRQAPAADLYLAGVVDPDSGRANSWDTARAMMRLAIEDRIDILNLSLGCFAATGPPFVITRAIERISPRVLVVAAAGNHGEFKKWVMGRTSKSAVWPASIPPVIAVGAHDGNGQSPPSWSPNLPWVACTAPGVDVIGRYFYGEVALPAGQQEFLGFARWSGTSFAAATVTGAIAARTRPWSVLPRAAYDNLLSPDGVVRMFPPTVTPVPA